MLYIIGLALPGIFSACGVLTQVSSSPQATFPMKPPIYIYAVAFSPDGQWVMTGTIPVRLWSVEKQREVGWLEGARAPIAFSPDGQMVAAAAHTRNDEGIYDTAAIVGLWSITDEVEKKTRFDTFYPLHHGDVKALAFSSDGELLASASEGKTAEARAIRIWDVPARRLIATLTGHGEQVNSVAFSPDGQLLASGGHDGTVRLWPMSDAEEVMTLTGHKDAVTCVAFRPHGQIIASGSWDGTIKLWSVAEGKEIATLKRHPQRVWSIAFSPDGQLLAGGYSQRSYDHPAERHAGDAGIKIWSVSQRKVITTFNANPPVAFSPDGQLLAGRVESGLGGVWNVSDITSR